MEPLSALLQKNVPNRRCRQTPSQLRLATVVRIERTYHHHRRRGALGGLRAIEFETLLEAAHAA